MLRDDGRVLRYALVALSLARTRATFSPPYKQTWTICLDTVPRPLNIRVSNPLHIVLILLK